MKQYFDSEGRMHLQAKNSTEMMALKQFEPLLAAHGAKAVVIHAEVPPKLKGVPAKE